MSFQVLAQLTLTTRRAALAVAAAAAGLALVAAPALGQAEGAGDGWTRMLKVDDSARELGVGAGTPARKLARAALARHAGRVGLSPSLRGVRVAATRHVPRPPRGAGELDLIRFQQTLRGTRVLWSQIDVAVAAGRVSSISATVVPVAGRRLRGERRVSRARALRIARRAVAGPERALQPLPVVHAGKPTTGRNAKARTPRRAWVVETTPASQRDAETPSPLCIVVDAETGKVIGRWWGIADRPDRGPQARGAQTASAHRDAATARAAQAGSGESLLNIRDGAGADLDTSDPFDGTTAYASFVLDGDPGRGASWPQFTDSAPFNRACTAPSAPLPCVNYRAAQSDVLDAVATNARNVAFTICAVRDYCGRTGRPAGEAGHLAWQVIGNVNGQSFADGSTLAVEIGAGDEMDGTPDCGPLGCPGGPQTPDPRQPFNDLIAHEFGHIMDVVYAGDRATGGRTVDEVEEGLADMFAYDYDRGDATAFEDTAGGTLRDWANPGAESLDGQPYPAHLDDYDPTPPLDAPHYNSTILSHAYHLFVDEVGHEVAGNVLQFVPFFLSPEPSFKQVAEGFYERATDLHGTSVAAAAASAFGQVGLRPNTGPEEPDCGPEAC